MIVHYGESRVGKGTYWSLSDGKRVEITDEGVLPGGSGTKYMKLPPAAMLLVGPFLGFVYVVFFPFMAIATVVALAAGKIFGSLLKGVSFGWRPATAHLSGKKKNKGG